jgi:T5SS/PEP-CTERM-associated repeat protein/autotransporter-associated beta strand protein
MRRTHQLRVPAFLRARVSRLCAATIVAFLGILSPRLQAGQTWDGGGADNNWTTSANWNATLTIPPQVPPPNDGTANIVMAGTTRLTPRVDVDWDINSLTFNSTAGGFSISGDPGVLLGIGAGGITNNDTQLQFLLLPIALDASQTWSAAAGPLSIGNTVAGHVLLSRTLTLDGPNNIQLHGAITNATSLIKTGTGTLTLDGLNTNTYTGTTTVSAGTLVLNRTGGPNRAIPGNLVIGDSAGSAGADVVRLDAANQIAETAGRTVTINGSGQLNLNGLNETIANLAINGGSVSGAGMLTVNESLSFPGGGSISAAMLAAPASSAIVDSGLLNISSGGSLTNTIGRISSTAGSNGTVTVDGANSKWTNLGDLHVGNLGQATLTIQNDATVESVGQLTIDDGSTVDLNGGTLRVGSLAGVQNLNWTAGALHLTAQNFVADNGGIFGSSPTIEPTQTLVASATNLPHKVGDSGAGMLTIDGGSADFGAGTLSVGDLAGSNGVLEIVNAGVVTSSTSHIGNLPSSVGEVRVDGNDSLWIIATIYDAGADPGHQVGFGVPGPSGTMLIELASASSYDQVIAGSFASLGGTLIVELRDGFTPSVGQSFTLLTADFIEGPFETEVLPTVPNLCFDVIYNLQSVVVTVVPALPGDFNADGIVDAADYVVWRKEILPPNAPTDYNTWRQHFAESASGSSGNSDTPSIPEPPLFMSAVVALILLLIKPRRRSRCRCSR